MIGKTCVPDEFGNAFLFSRPSKHIIGTILNMSLGEAQPLESAFNVCI